MYNEKDSTAIHVSWNTITAEMSNGKHKTSANGLWTDYSMDAPIEKNYDSKSAQSVFYVYLYDWFW